MYPNVNCRQGLSCPVVTCHHGESSAPVPAPTEFWDCFLHPALFCVEGVDWCFSFARRYSASLLSSINSLNHRGNGDDWQCPFVRAYLPYRTRIPSLSRGTSGVVASCTPRHWSFDEESDIIGDTGVLGVSLLVDVQYRDWLRNALFCSQRLLF